MQTATTAPHRAPVMNATREQTMAMMAVAAAGDRPEWSVHFPFQLMKRRLNSYYQVCRQYTVGMGQRA